MFIFLRFLPWLSSFLIFLSFEFIYIRPNLIWWFSGLIILTVIGSHWFILGKDFKEKHFGELIISPLSLVVSALLFFTFLEGILIQQFFILIVTFFLGFYLENLFIFWYLKPRYKPFTLENISNYTNFLSIFLLFSSFYNLNIFLHLPLWLILIFTLTVALLLTYQTLWVNKIWTKETKIYLGGISLVIGEFFGILWLLPFTSYVKGILVASLFYLLINLSEHHLKESLNRKIATKYLLGTFLIWILVLATARWS